MSIRLGDMVWHKGHGFVPRFASCDCYECEKEEESK